MSAVTGLMSTMIEARVERMRIQQDPTAVAMEKNIVAEMDQVIEQRIAYHEEKLRDDKISEAGKRYHEARLNYYQS